MSATEHDDAAGAMASTLAGARGESLEVVSYRLDLRGGPQVDWRVRRVHMVEAISEPYELTLDVFTELDVETDTLLGVDADLEICRGTFERHVQGLIERVDLLGVIHDRLLLRLYVAPAFKLLAQHVDARIFQDRTVPKILDEVLTASLAQYGRKLDVSQLNDTYLTRDYCVQYGESAFHFSSRIMEEEGIAYYFEPEIVDDQPTGVELMILADHDPAAPNSDFPEIDGEIPDHVPILADSGELGATEGLRYLKWVRPQVATMLSTRRFNWKRPGTEVAPTATEEGADALGRTREIYVPDIRRRIEDSPDDPDYPGPVVEEDEIPLTRRRFEALGVDRAFGHGASNVSCLRAGGRFTLADHNHPELAFSELLVTRVVHHGSCPDDASDADFDPEESYQNDFDCIPAQTPFRPPETTIKPRVLGPQTAIVTGPPGKEIHTDKHGRIEVAFHWDRHSRSGTRTSSWVRVAQLWAGRGWGTWFLPRVGMEVVVEFLDGNPDRPLVVGCVYNGDNVPPYRPDEQPTKSTLKTNSSPDGEGFNELRFEDAKGTEELYVHAQKDYKEVVRSNRSRRVGGNETVAIGGNQTVMVEGAPVHGDPQAPRPGRSTTIVGHEHIEATETVHIKAPKRIVLEVPGSSIVLEPDAIKIISGGGATIAVDADVMATSSTGSSLLLSDQVALVADTTLEIAGRTVRISGDSEVIIKGGIIRLN